MAAPWRIPRRRGVTAALLALLVGLAMAVPVAAHSELVSSIPAAGSTVSWAPGMSIVLSFSETLKKGSKADVVGPGGTTVGTATMDPTDDTKLSWSPAAALLPGSYTIRWTSIATDGDVLRGTIPFTVVAAATATPSAATATPATPAPSTATPTPSPTPGDVSAAGFGAIVPVFAALLVIALLALVLLRNRRPTARR
jgi:methionine-rich copper-binding protein CopC